MLWPRSGLSVKGESHALAPSLVSTDTVQSVPYAQSDTSGGPQQTPS